MKLLLFLLFVTQANAASWYVDKSASGSNNGTSEANAWTALSNIVYGSLSAGDTVFVKSGTYTEVVFDGVDSTNIWYLNKSGSSGNPITFTTLDGPVFLNGNHNPNIRYGLQLGGSHLKIDGGLSTNFHFINCTNMQDRNLGIAVFNGGSGITVTRIVVSNWNNGLLLSAGTTKEISSNRLVRISGDVAIGDNSTVQSFGNVRVFNNYIECTVDAAHSGGADGIKTFNGADIFGNELRNLEDIGFPGSQHPDCVQFTACGNFTRIYRNRFYTFANAVFEFGYSAGCSNVWVSDNVISGLYDPRLDYAAHNAVEGSFDGTTSNSFWNICFVNNTFVDVGIMGLAWQKLSGITVSNHPPITNFITANNIFKNAGDRLGAFYQIGNYPNTNFTRGATQVYLGHNVVDPGVSGSTNAFENFQHATQAIFPQVHTIFSDPLFTSYTAFSNNVILTLTSSSPAIGAGTNLTALYSQFGISPVDYSGTARPSVGAWDIGAYQFTQAGDYSSGARPNRLRGIRLNR